LNKNSNAGSKGGPNGGSTGRAVARQDERFEEPGGVARCHLAGLASAIGWTT